MKDILEPESLYYRDNKSYFNILIDDNIRKWVCRLYLNGVNKSIMLNNESRATYPINKDSDIIQYKDDLFSIIEKFK